MNDVLNRELLENSALVTDDQKRKTFSEMTATIPTIVAGGSYYIPPKRTGLDAQTSDTYAL